MHRMLYSIFIWMILSINGYAKCSTYLRLSIRESLGHKVHASLREDSNQYYQFKNKIFNKVTSKIPNMSISLENKRYLQDKKLAEIIQRKLVPQKINSSLIVIREIMNNPELIRSWVESFHKDLIEYLYQVESVDNLLILEKYGEVTELQLLNFMLLRSRKAGFSGSRDDLEILKDDLTPKEFGKILRSKKLIIDKVFSDKNHGKLIHILHIDIMIFALERAKINPLLISEIYQWFGKAHRFELDAIKGTFDSLTTGWQALFDSFESDLTSPEVLNPIISEYLQLVRSDI